MRIRTIKPEWLEDEELAAASDEARVLSVALILMSDDHGRGRASIATIAAETWRYALERNDGADAPEVLAKASRALRELVDMGFVRLYSVRAQRYFEIHNWKKHQKVDKPSAPRVPAPEEQETSEKSHIRETLATHSRVSSDTLATDLDPDLDPIPRPGGEQRAVAPAPAASSDQSTQEPLPGSIGAILRAAPLPAEPDAPCQLPEFTEATIKAVRRQVHDLYTAKVGYSHDLNGQHVQRLTQTLRGVAQARGEALPAVVERAVLGFLADPYWQSKRWPLNGLVRQAAQYADPAKPEDIKVPDSGANQAKLSSLRSKISAAETERKLAASMNPGAVSKLDERIDGMRREMKRLEGAA